MKYFVLYIYVKEKLIIIGFRCAHTEKTENDVDWKAIRNIDMLLAMHEKIMIQFCVSYVLGDRNFVILPLMACNWCDIERMESLFDRDWLKWHK